MISPRVITISIITCASLLLNALSLFALTLQKSPESAKPTDQAQKLVIEQIKATVVFIEADLAGRGLVPLGTGS
jgi:hypothetical protein